MYFLNMSYKLNSYEILKYKFDDINSSTLSVAFLISANIFLINIVKDNKIISLYYTNILLFCASMLFLLCSLYKKNNYVYNYDIINILFIKELLFNLVIIMNVFIVLNYIFSFLYLYK
jgi:hypothetical protein